MARAAAGGSAAAAADAASSRSSCLRHPAVSVRGSAIELNQATPNRFFLAGMVYSSPVMLSGFDEHEFESVVIAHEAVGATALRWNVFLKGLDLVFAPNDNAGRVLGLRPKCLENLQKGLDIAKRHNVLVQVVLATAHFCRCGWGGCENSLRGVRNADRVARNRKMLGTAAGIDAYLRNVLTPLVEAVGRHEALAGFLIMNEGYSLVRSQDNLFTYLTDETLSLLELQRWAAATELSRSAHGGTSTLAVPSSAAGRCIPRVLRALLRVLP